MITAIGTGTGAPLDASAIDALRAAGLVVGAGRRIEAARLLPGAGGAAEGSGVVVPASGDPGSFGIVRAFAERFGPAELDIRPGVSSPGGHEEGFVADFAADFVEDFVVGVGAGKGVPAEEVVGLVEDTLRDAGISPASVTALATVDTKAAEPGVVGAAARLGVPVVTYTADQLAGVDVPNPSAAPLSAVGTPSVAEAAALLLGGGELVVPKRKSAPEGRASMATCAVVRRSYQAPLTSAPPQDLNGTGTAIKESE
ncbi:hypothetical protein GCM10009837_32460 [Streptomyces durmitorensis]